MSPVRQLLRTELQNQLRQSISNGKPPAGSFLSPADLATQYDVSPTPMREALIELTRDGLLDNLANRGFIVRPLTAPEAREVYSLMWVLESTALRTGMPEAVILEDMVRINTAFAAASEPVDVQDLDAEFHRALISGCTNASLLELIETLRWRVRRYEIAYMKHAKVAWQSAAHHHAMVLALKRNDVERTVEVLQQNWLQSVDAIAQWLSLA